MFKRKTVDSILAGFQKTVNELNALGERYVEDAKAKNTEAVRLQVESQRLYGEADRAHNAASRIEKLIAG